MEKVISNIEDITLELYKDVTIGRNVIRLSESLQRKIDERRTEFLDYVKKHRNNHLYGITTRQHVGAKKVLDDDSLKEFGSRLPAYGASLGEKLPDRLVRGIIIARLADYINGTSGIRSKTVMNMLKMLDKDTLPKVAARGNGEPGDIIVLGALFQDEFSGQLEIGEGMALINGSPVASAALADVVVQYEQYISKMEDVFSLAALAIHAPLQHFDSRLADIWNDPFISATLANIRENLTGIDHEQMNYQAPVSFRSAPRVFGWFRRMIDQAQNLALLGLRNSSNNPAFVDADSEHESNGILSNGGYHHPYSAPMIDALIRSVADVSQILISVNNRVVEMPNGLLELEPEPEVSTLYHVAAGWGEEVRSLTLPSLISLANGGQTDTGTSDLLAWRKASEATEGLEAILSVLAITSSHLITRKNEKVTARLESIYKEIMERFPLDTTHTDFNDAIKSVQCYLFK